MTLYDIYHPTINDIINVLKNKDILIFNCLFNVMITLNYFDIHLINSKFESIVICNSSSHRTDFLLSYLNQ